MLGANGDVASLNLYAYCGNNPVSREDSNGKFWLLTAAAKIGIGIATQYIADVIGNVLDGQTGWNIFTPTSTIGEYVAAGVTALIPGSGVVSSVFGNVVSEAIVNVEKHIKGEEINLMESVANIAICSAIDVGFNKVTDFADEKIASLEPQNYSTYAGKQYKKNPNLTMPEIKNKMSKVYKAVNVGRGAVSFTSGIVRNIMPY